MNVHYTEKIVKSMVAALMNGRIYFPRHHRAIEALEQVRMALDGYFSEGGRAFRLSCREGLLIHEGVPLFDLSIFGHQLIRFLDDSGCSGFTLAPSVTGEELIELLELLIGKTVSSAEEGQARLKARGVERIVLESALVVERMEEHPHKEEGAGSGAQEQRISREIYTEALAVLHDIMVSLHKDHRVSFNASRGLAEQITQIVNERKESLLSLTASKNYDAFTFNHSVNVCIYAATVAEHFTADESEVVSIAQAALLHDVGKLLVPEQIINKPEMLSPEDWEIMRQHPVMGAKILMEAEGSHEIAVNVAYGHHLRYDRQGYPEPHFEMAQDPIVNLMNVIDVYEALTARRPYKPPIRRKPHARCSSGGREAYSARFAWIRFYARSVCSPSPQGSVLPTAPLEKSWPTTHNIPSNPPSAWTGTPRAGN